MVKVYCSRCGRFSWDIDMVVGEQIVRCPQCSKKTKIRVYHGDSNVLKYKSFPW